MRISDWSSDVCSSDLCTGRHPGRGASSGAESGSGPGYRVPFMNSPASPVPDMEQQLSAAARRLAQGGLVAFPTETVYGLGADAENPQALASIYAAKGRPANHPVIVHVAPEADLGYWAASVPAERSEEHPSELQSLLRI